VDWTNPTNVMAARGLYLLAQALVALGWFWVTRRIAATADATRIWVRDVAPANPLGALFGGGANAEPAPWRATTYAEHESARAEAAMRQAGTSTAMMFGMSLYFGMIVPLALQVLLGPLAVLEDLAFQKHALGTAPPRPWGERRSDPEAAPGDNDPVEGAGAGAAVGAATGTGAELARWEDAVLRAWEGNKAPTVAQVREWAAAGLSGAATRQGKWTVGMVAAGANAPEVLAAWVAGGGRVEAVDAEGWTLLHWAAHHDAAAAVAAAATAMGVGEGAGKAAAVRARAGATGAGVAGEAAGVAAAEAWAAAWGAVDAKGRTALQVAEACGHADTAAALRRCEPAPAPVPAPPTPITALD
jgi:hypothetical protein